MKISRKRSASDATTRLATTNTQSQSLADDPIISTRGLTKHFGSTVALSNVDLTVQRGEVFAFLGPNGAGKTTMIRLLLDSIRPTAGTARIFGLEVGRDRIEIHRRVGYLPAELGAWKRLSGRDWLTWVATVRNVDCLSEAFSLAERFDLDLSRPIGDLSMGNRRKIGVVQAFMHSPDLVILDEPTNGLDPLMQVEFRRLLEEWRNAGRTVFLSSHALDEVQHVADQVGIIDSGRLAAVQPLRTLLKQTVVKYDVTFKTPISPDELSSLRHVSDVAADGAHITVTVEGAPNAFITWLSQFDVISLTSQNADLEDVFIRYYSQQGDKHAS